MDKINDLGKEVISKTYKMIILVPTIIAIISSLVFGFVSKGIYETKVDNLDKRVEILEKNIGSMKDILLELRVNIIKDFNDRDKIYVENPELK